MKLKYYLRGLGTGIIFTAIVLMIIYSYRTTDSKIIDKARELGMVMPKETSASAEDEQSTQQETNEPSSAEEMTTVEDVTGESVTDEPVTEPEREETTTEEPATEPQTEETTTKEPETEPQTTEMSTEPATEQATTAGVEVTFTISSGMYSETVSQRLYEQGVVDDASAFNRYLSQNGYASKLKTGTYTLTKGMSYEAVAAAITQ